MVDLEQPLPGRGRGWTADLVVAGRERAVIVAPIDEGVDHLAVGVDRRLPHGAGRG